MKNLILMIMVAFVFSGCSVAQKTRELGQSISNIRHPVALGVGAILYKVGKENEYDKKELDTTEQVIEIEGLEVEFEE